MQNNALYRDYKIGCWTMGRPTIRSWVNGSKFTAGKYSGFSDSAMVMLDQGNNHRIDAATTYSLHVLSDGFDVEFGDPSFVKIGNDVMVCTQAMILPGVTIGDGAIIAAGAVVSRNIPPYAIAAGNPAKIVRYRFESEVIERLEKLAWWDWPEETVFENKHILCGKLDEEALLKLEKVDRQILRT